MPRRQDTNNGALRHVFRGNGRIAAIRVRSVALLCQACATAAHGRPQLLKSANVVGG